MTVDIHPVAVERPMDALRDEHRGLVPTIERLRRIADDLGEGPHVSLRAETDAAFVFLTEHVIPHAIAEDEVLYPAVARILRAPNATATMSLDHAAVVRLVDELGVLRHFAAGGPTVEHANDLRRTLYGLHALLTTHLGKEEEVYLPLLDDGLTVDEGTRLLEAMARAADRVRVRMPAR